MTRLNIIVSIIALMTSAMQGLCDETPKQQALYSEDYAFVTQDGAWCWFSDPRAIYVDNLIVGGYVDKEGSIWAFSYDPADQTKKYFKVFDKLQYDDHSNPSVMALPDKRIAIFFSAHGPSPIYYRISERPADITSWGELNALTPGVDGKWGFCYTNPMMLSAESNRTYLFFRGPNFKPCVIYSNDLKTWSDPVTAVDKKPGPKSGGRPYLKAATNGKDKIFLAFTDGHPRDQATNSIYFVMLKDGKFFKADGTQMTEGLESIYPEDADVVYDATKTFDKAWIWDIAVDENDNPVLVYARFKDANNEHSYWWARWDGEKWENHHIINAGQWFMRKDYNDKNIIEKENNYSGGVYLDHNNPYIVYTSRPINNVFEIEKWTKNVNSKGWTCTPVTEESERDNVRPFVIRNYPEGYPSVMWMYNYIYPYFREYVSAIRIDQKDKGFDASFDKAAVKAVSDAVFNWQMESYRQNPFLSQDARGWRAGVLYNGMFDWARTTGESAYFKFLTDIFKKEKWQVGNRMYHADDLCVGQAYLDFYIKDGNKDALIPTQARLEWIINNQPDSNIDNRKGKSDRWWWCDALYMAPAVFSRLWQITGDEAYMKFAHKEYKATQAQLYDYTEHLFYRDSKFLDSKEANGKPVFWSRGNGWVMGGLMELLQTIPEKDRKYRPYYLGLFREMASRIKELQQEDGFWRSSLLDPQTYTTPETSGTGLFVAALAYGVNKGYLPKDEYLPVVEKGWAALVSAVDTEGKLGWVQPVAASPKQNNKKSTQLYGVGAFLCAAAQIYEMSE